MPLEYNPIHHGQFLQLTGELGLGPDDVAAILQVDASIIKRAYKGTKAIKPDQLNTLWNLYLIWLSWASRIGFEAQHSDQAGYMVYTNQQDYLNAPHDKAVWPTYKVHLNLMAKVASHLDHRIMLIPYLNGVYQAYLATTGNPDSYDMRQTWANSVAKKGAPHE
jgi:hypothetical protein